MTYTKYKVQKELTLDDKYRVFHVGMDSSSRPILMSPRMWGFWLSCMEDEDLKPFANEIDIVQGAFMAFLGGGADASAGYHDLSSCLDIRTWDIDTKEERAFIHVTRKRGAATWRRDQEHGGFDEHFHLTLLDEPNSAWGAQTQWTSYRNGGDGMGGSDYHPRPDPIPVFDFKKWKEEHWFEMATKADLREVVDKALAEEREKLAQAVKKEILHNSDIFPNDPSKNVSVNDALAREYNRS